MYDYVIYIYKFCLLRVLKKIMYIVSKIIILWEFSNKNNILCDYPLLILYETTHFCGFIILLLSKTSKSDCPLETLVREIDGKYSILFIFYRLPVLRIFVYIIIFYHVTWHP